MPMGERRKYTSCRNICKLQNFISFLMALIIYGNFQTFSLWIITSLSKMSLEGTIVLGRLRSELCSWGVKSLPGMRRRYIQSYNYTYISPYKIHIFHHSNIRISMPFSLVLNALGKSYNQQLIKQILKFPKNLNESFL